MVERPAKPHLYIFASVSYDRSTPDRWPELIVRVHQFGVEGIVIRPLWGWHTSLPGPADLHGHSDPQRDLVSLIQLCQAAGLMVAIDLGGIDTPPLHVLRAHPTLAIAETDVLPRVQPLHPQLRSETQQWITQLTIGCMPLQQPHGPIVAHIAPNLPMAALSVLEEWLHSAGWRIPLLRKLSPLNLGADWPFEQVALHAGDIDNLFRSDGSANLNLWNIKPFVALLRGTAMDLSSAQPPAGQPGIRNAWADGPDMDVQVRHTEQSTYLSIHNRRSEPYSGMLTYRNREGELLHLHANLGPQRGGVVLLFGEEIVGVAFTGDASEGVWLVRAMRSSIVFNGGAGGVIPSGRGVSLMAAQSGRFQLRRMEGWDHTQSYRLTMSGRLLVCPCQIEAQHLTVPYIAEDQHGQTDRYLIVVSNDPLPGEIEQHLRILLTTRAAALHTAALICRNDSRQQLASAAAKLESITAGTLDLHEYRAVWATTEQLITELQQRIQQEQAKLQLTRYLLGEEVPGEEEAWRIQALPILERLTRTI